EGAIVLKLDLLEFIRCRTDRVSRVRLCTAPVQLGLAQKQSQTVARRPYEQRAERVHATVVVHGMSDRTATEHITLWIDMVAIGTVELRRIGVELAGRIGKLDMRTQGAGARRSPRLEPDLAQ